MYHYPQGMENANVSLLHTDEDDFQVLHLLLCHADRLAKVLYCGRLRQSNGHQVNATHGLQSMFRFVTKESLEMICSMLKIRVSGIYYYWKVNITRESREANK